MKYNINDVIVVEGKQDVSYLSSFINANYFITNGYDLSEDKIAFLKQVSQKKKIIVFTDSDTAGEVIRNRLINQINNSFVVKISGKSRKNYKKHGVAEGNMNEIINSLSSYFENEFIKEEYNLNTLFIDSEHGQLFKNALINHYRLIFGNTKSIEQQLNMLDVKPLEVLKLWEEVKHGN